METGGGGGGGGVSTRVNETEPIGAESSRFWHSAGEIQSAKHRTRVKVCSSKMDEMTLLHQQLNKEYLTWLHYSGAGCHIMQVQVTWPFSRDTFPLTKITYVKVQLKILEVQWPLSTESRDGKWGETGRWCLDMGRQNIVLLRIKNSE